MCLGILARGEATLVRGGVHQGRSHAAVGCRLSACHSELLRCVPLLLAQSYLSCGVQAWFNSDRLFFALVTDCYWCR